MDSAPEMPLDEVLQALSHTPLAQPQLRAVLATTCARWELQQGLEEQAMRHLGEALELVPDLRPAMRLLYRIHFDRSDVRTAVMYLDEEIRATRHPREAAALYRERGQMVEAHFRDLSAAQQCYQAALKATPRDLAVLRSVERVSLARGDVFWLIANLEAQLEVLRDPGATAGVLRDLAMLETRHRGDLTLGADLLLMALESFPSHLGLVADLFRVAEVAGDAELMLRALELEAEARPAPGRAIPLARASATLREHRQRAAAISIMQAAAHAQPHNYSLWRSLEELSMATSRYETALDACVGQIKAVGDQEDAVTKAELYHRLGKLALFRLNRIPEGLSAMRKALRLYPGHMPAIEDTARFLISNEMWAQLLELLKLQISTAKKAGLTSQELALTHVRAGQVLEEHIGELEGARQFYEDAIRAHRGFRVARDRRERILHQLARLDELRAHYQEELEITDDPPRKVLLLSLLGQLHARQEDPSESIKYLVALLREVPEHLPALQLLARLLARANRPKELLRVTEQEINLTISPLRKAKLLHRSGELALQLGTLDRARQYFSEALDAVDDHSPSMRNLEALLREQEDWEPLVELLRKRLLYANDRGRQVALRLEIASLLSTKLQRREEALEELEGLLERWPRHLPALHAAENLASGLQRHESLLRLLEQHIFAVTGPRTRALLLHRAALVRSRGLGDHDGAIRDLARALELWPQLGVARARLLRLYEHLGRSDELQAFAEAGLASERGSDDRRAMALQLAELTPKAVVAMQYLATVAQARPEDYVTQLRLARACRLARHPGREAAALLSAVDSLEQGSDGSDPYLLALRYRAARAREAAADLDGADEAYARILDLDPGHELARRGRVRLKERKREAVLMRSAEDIEQAAQRSSAQADRAAYRTIAAELHERRHDLEQALRQLDSALQDCPDYLPALHAKVRVLQRQGQPEHLRAASRTLLELAEVLTPPRPKARALNRAATVMLEMGTPDRPHAQAWELFARALDIDPGCDEAFFGIQQTLARHGTEGASGLRTILRRRLDHLLAAAELGPASLRDLARLGRATEGSACSAELLERGIDVAPDDPGLRGELAQDYALLERWDLAVEQFECAIQREPSPERRAALHYFAGVALERGDRHGQAVRHLLSAGRGGFHPLHALLRADRIATQAGSVEQRVEALQLLVELGHGVERARSLRALADLHRNQLGQPDVAVELMRELLLLRPTDIEVIQELRRLLEKLERHDEANAALLAGIAHHRAWLRTQGLAPTTENETGVEPVEGLLQLFDALEDSEGVYVASSVIEVVAPQRISPGRSCDDLVSEPWPLPRPQEGRPFDALIGDLASSSALDLLREGVFALNRIPGNPDPGVDIDPDKSLDRNSASVIVVRALSHAMGVPQPLVFVDVHREDTVLAHVGAVPSLILGRRINAAPFTPSARDRIGRALLRLTVGGDYVHHEASDEAIVGLVVGLCQVSGISSLPGAELDPAVVENVANNLEELPVDLQEAAQRLAGSLGSFSVSALRESLQMAEDRAGAVCAADPRPAIARLLEGDAITDSRGTALIGYLLSDDHLSLRRTLGYQAEIELTDADVEEVSA